MKQYLVVLLWGCAPLLADAELSLSARQTGETAVMENGIDMYKAPAQKKSEKKKNWANVKKIDMPKERKKKTKMKSSQPRRISHPPAAFPIDAKSMSIIEITEENFESQLRENPKMVLDVYATWCGPCKRLAPILQELSVEMKDQCAFGKLNGDNNPALLERLNVKSFPTLIFYDSGEEVERSVGAMRKEDLSNLITRKFNP